MKFAYNLSSPTFAYLDTSQDVATTQSIADADPVPEEPMVQLTPVSHGSEKASGIDWTFSLILGCGCLMFASLTTAACCCRFPPCRG